MSMENSSMGITPFLLQVPSEPWKARNEIAWRNSSSSRGKQGSWLWMRSSSTIWFPTWETTTKPSRTRNPSCRQCFLRHHAFASFRVVSWEAATGRSLSPSRNSVSLWRTWQVLQLTSFPLILRLNHLSMRSRPRHGSGSGRTTRASFWKPFRGLRRLTLGALSLTGRNQSCLPLWCLAWSKQTVSYFAQIASNPIVRYHNKILKLRLGLV